ncbi:hypothetical protein IG631_08398 [Alternaria alternata]|nr:hypothetical protein IG631_08398 [Alternaria alternata]
MDQEISAILITPSYHIRSAQRAGLSTRRFFRVEILMTSNQSKGFDDVMWLGGVLGIPLELKRLALRDWYLAPFNRFRDLLDISSAHVICPGVTLPPISLANFDRR